MEHSVMHEGAALAVGHEGHEAVQWRCHWLLEKRHGDWTGEQIDAGDAPAPHEEVAGDGNLLVTAGANILWTKLTGGAGTVFDNSNAYLGVGDSATAAAVGQTDLQAASNKFRKAMDATYPQVSTNQVTFRSTFATGDANYAWAEWATFNASSGGTMLNRKVESLGTKSSGSWTLTVTLSLS